MSTRGRRPGFKMPEEHRVKIANSNILNALIEHVEGRRDMSATQVSAGLGLLKKVMPDLSHNEHTGEDGGPLELIQRIELVAGRAHRASSETD